MTITAGAAGKQAGASLCRAAGLLLAVLASGAAGPARAAEAAPGFSPWVSSGHAAARLVADGPGSPRRAGIEIRLDPDAITYWRNPGEAGLPPTLNTAGSQNVARVVMTFPAPTRLDEGGSTAFGYTGDVVLPLEVTLLDPGQPALLAADLDYAVCTAVCQPAQATLRLPLPVGAVPEASALLTAAAARVPRPAALGEPGPLAVTAVRPAGAGFDVTIRGGAPARLFVEPPEGWYMDAGSPPSPVLPDGGRRVHIDVLQRPSGADGHDLPLRLTLVEGDDAVEVSLRMDVPPATP